MNIIRLKYDQEEGPREIPFPDKSEDEFPGRFLHYMELADVALKKKPRLKGKERRST